MRVTARHTAVLASALAVGGCGFGGGGGATKAGGPSGPVTLQMASTDDLGSRTDGYARNFAARVQELSEGRLRIKLRPDAGKVGGDYELQLARTVTSGEFEMGIIPSHTWDLLGVTSLRALNAPFLITNQALLADVISSELGATMLSGLDRAGLVGLALLPGPLVHPFGFDQPLLGAEDYRGKVVWGIESQTTEALWHALGARSVRGQALDRDLQRGLAFPFESGAEATVTANVTLYPQLDSVVIGARTYKRLDDHQRAILRQAAADTRALAIETIPNDALKAREFCAGAPGTLRGTVRASAAQVAGLEAAATPVYTALERDPLTRSVIARIRARAPEVPAPTDPTPSCPAERMTPITGKASSALDGVYRFELTDPQIRTEAPDPEFVKEFHGIYTYTLSGGRYCYEQKMPDGRTYPNPNYTPGACGIYRLSGDRIMMSTRTGEPVTLRWSRATNGDLRLKVASSGAWGPALANLVAGEPWQRIGG